MLWLLKIMNLVCQKNLSFFRRQCAMEMSLACLTVLDFILSISLETSAKMEITRLEFGALKVSRTVACNYYHFVVNSLSVWASPLLKLNLQQQ